MRVALESRPPAAATDLREAMMALRVQSLTDGINELEVRGLISRRPEGAELLQRDSWLFETTRDHLTELGFNLLMLTAPALRKLADA